MACGNRSIAQSGNRRRPRLGVALVLVCGLSSVIAPLPAEAWGKKKKGKTSAGAPSAQKISAVASKMLQKARVLREKGKNEQAIETYKQALQIDPALPEAYLELADIYSDINIPESASAMLEAGLPLAEQLGYEPAALAAAWCRAAELNVRLGNLDLASGDLVKATTLDPDDPLPHKIAGDIHAVKQRYEDAFKAYREAVRLDPQFGDAWAAMGTLALETKRAKEAQAAYNGLLGADTDRARQFAESMRQARLKPVVTQKQSPERIAAPADDPYAVPGTPSGSDKPKAAVPPAPKPVVTTVRENPYEGIEPRPVSSTLPLATKASAAAASRPPASASAGDTDGATPSRQAASAPARVQAATSPETAQAAAGAPATEAA
ncbi:MAG TPA: tetratricopeptide repeat protein, partial [Candidatus Ozemobacteraceae bacterium]|nr:tetratricopeptide repeat protein [Candidatus Ozemobacteraceae bacterium]